VLYIGLIFNKMNCKNCGKKIRVGHKFCTNCGNECASGIGGKLFFGILKKIRRVFVLRVNSIIPILVIVFLMGNSIYSSLDESSIEKNNSGLSSYDSGNVELSINKLKEAKELALTSDSKMNASLNLAYVYFSEGRAEESLLSFKDALSYTKEGSFYYYLISGEIALAEARPDDAKFNYDQAYKQQPNNFQINNALSLFYLDISRVAPSYHDPAIAIQYAQRVFEFSDIGKKNNAIRNLAVARYYNEDFDDVISLLTGADYSGDAHSDYWIGLAYYGKDDDVNAKLYFQKAADGGIELGEEVVEYLGSK